MQSIGVIGHGVLGSAIVRGFMEWADIKVFDVRKERATHSLAEAATCDIVFVALPTPAKPDGRCDTSAIDKFLEDAYANRWWEREACYVIRSTIPVGHTKSLAEKYAWSRPLLHSPEFLTARCAQTDFQCPARNIIGDPHEWRYGENDVYWNAASLALRMLYEKRFPGAPVHVMSSDASELVKLACNSFFASKVTLFNLFHDLAKARGLDWEDVRGGILSDGRIAHAHTLVPGNDGPGFSGTCLGKDTADLFHCCQEAGVDAALLREVIDRNRRSRPNDKLIDIRLP